MMIASTLALFTMAAAQSPAVPPMARSGPAGTAAEDVVQRQLDAYNRHDIEAFAATYADDVDIVRPPAKVDIKGKAALRATYARLFAQLKPTARVPHRTVMGDRIADVEAITIGGTEYCCALAIYEVKGGFIRRVDLIMSDDFLKPKKD
jgi:hypothetical protein